MWVWRMFKLSGWLTAFSVGLTAMAIGLRRVSDRLYDEAEQISRADPITTYQLNAEGLAVSEFVLVFTYCTMFVSVISLVVCVIAAVGLFRGKLVLPGQRDDLQQALNTAIVGLADIENRAEKGSKIASDAEAIIALTKEQVAAVKRQLTGSQKLGIALGLVTFIVGLVLTFLQLYWAGDLPGQG